MELLQSMTPFEFRGKYYLIEYELPNGDKRTLILIRKVSETPDKYPRNAGQMKKKKL